MASACKGVSRSQYTEMPTDTSNESKEHTDINDCEKNNQHLPRFPFHDSNEGGMKKDTVYPSRQNVVTQTTANARNSKKKNNFSPMCCYVQIDPHVPSDSVNGTPSQRKKEHCVNDCCAVSWLLHTVALISLIVLVSFYFTNEIRRQDSQKSTICLKCDLLQTLLNGSMVEPEVGVVKTEDGKCCVSSVESLLPGLVKKLEIHHEIERNNKIINILLNRRRSVIHLIGRVLNTSIVWEAKIREGSLKYDEGGVHIQTGGNYFLYSNVAFKKGPCHTHRPVRYFVKLKGSSGPSTILASVQKPCFNGINYEQDFATGIVFNVPVRQKSTVFIEIDSGYRNFVLKDYVHTFSVYEI